MHCPNCNTQIPDGSDFCVYCGTAIINSYNNDTPSEASKETQAELPFEENEAPYSDSGAYDNNSAYEDNTAYNNNGAYDDSGAYEENPTYQEDNAYGADTVFEENPPYASPGPFSPNPTYKTYTPIKPEHRQKNFSPAMVAAVSVLSVLLVVALVFIVLISTNKISVAPSPDSADDSFTTTTLPSAESIEQTEGTTEGKIFTTTTTANSTTVPSGVVSPEFYYKSEIFYVEPSVGIHLRKGPGTNYDSLKVIDQNDAVKIIGGTDSAPDWAYVLHTKSNSYGWVSTEYITSSVIATTTTTRVSSNAVSYYNGFYYGRVTPDVGINIRSGPGTSYSKIGFADGNEVLTVRGYSLYNSEWYYVQYGNVYGFVKGEYLYVY